MQDKNIISYKWVNSASGKCSSTFKLYQGCISYPKGTAFIHQYGCFFKYPWNIGQVHGKMAGWGVFTSEQKCTGVW